MNLSPTILSRAGILALTIAAACAAPSSDDRDTASAARTGTEHVVTERVVAATFDAAGTAAPLRQATLSTRLMGTITAVLVEEGDAVRAGQLLARIDARELDAKSSQVAASLAGAEAVHRDAVTQAARIRALYADSAATRAQLDAAETGLVRAEAAVAAARGARAELQAMSSYAEIRAPFDGIVTQRFVDPGAFAAPGAPLLAVQDESQLRISVSAAPEAASRIRRGQLLDGTIEGRAVRATVEGVVPAGGNLYVVNARVRNRPPSFLAGSAATLALPIGDRRALVVPAAAVIREGDLTGVVLRIAGSDVRRWVRLGQRFGDLVEVNAGLTAGDRIVIPDAVALSAGEN